MSGFATRIAAHTDTVAPPRVVGRFAIGESAPLPDRYGERVALGALAGKENAPEVMLHTVGARTVAGSLETEVIAEGLCAGLVPVAEVIGALCVSGHAETIIETLRKFGALDDPAPEPVAETEPETEPDPAPEPEPEPVAKSGKRK